ncbi:MAG: SGNH/GDSL hydrolase family protein [Pseudomonadota bacterium]
MLLDLTARTVLLPVLLGQAAYARRTARSLPEPEGPREGRVGQGPPLRVLIIGDSSAAGVGVPTQDEALTGQLSRRLSSQFTVEFHLDGVTGARTIDTVRRLHAKPAQSFDVAVTALGVNDVTKGISLRRWLEHQAELYDLLRDKFGAQQILVSSLPPVHQFPLLPNPLRWVLGRQAQRFDRALHLLTEQQEGCEIVTFDLTLDASNMSPDGFHPGPIVYAAWADRVARRIPKPVSA